MDQRTFDEKVRELATKLKNQGVVTSDAQAKMMAESILSTERRQTERFEKKQFDPSQNPQQRMREPVDKAQLQSEVLVEEPPKEILSGPTGTVSGVDQNKPISELLQEDSDSESEVAQQLQSEQQVEVPPTQNQEEPEVASNQQDVSATEEPQQTGNDPADKEPEPKKDDRPKVDLTEMFNFSKRR